MTTVSIGSDDAGCRLDRWVRKRLALKSLSEIYRLIRTGGVRVNGRKRPGNYRLEQADEVDMDVAASEIASKSQPGTGVAHLAETSFFQRNFMLLYEDESLMVCDKPAGLVVHSGTGHTGHDSLIGLATSHMLQTTHGRRDCGPVLAHRLDRDTSGVIVIAKNKQTVRALNESLRERTFSKEYLAICHGTPQPRQGTIELDLVRNYEKNDGTRVRVGEHGQPSRTTYRVASSNARLSRLEVRIHTGRTHQIRVHLAHIGHPVVGDVRYGDRLRDQVFFKRSGAAVRRLYLHAHRISFRHPDLDRMVTFEGEIPSEFDRLWRVSSQRRCE